MIYGYARVSTTAQDESSQVAQLKAAGCEKIFREKITGTTADRPQLKKLIGRLTAGDVVITPAVDRLSRDCKRKVEMTPFFKVEMALFRVPRSREIHQLRPETADRKEGRPLLLPPLYFVT